jgi:hypothetical protein
MDGYYFHDILIYVEEEHIQDLITILYALLKNVRHDQEVFHEYEYCKQLNS